MSATQTLTMASPPAFRMAQPATSSRPSTSSSPTQITVEQAQEFLALLSMLSAAQSQSASSGAKAVGGCKGSKSTDDLDSLRSSTASAVPRTLGPEGEVTIDTGRHELIYRPALATKLYDYSVPDVSRGGRGWYTSDTSDASARGAGFVHNARVQESWADHNAEIDRLKASLADDERLVLLEMIRHEQGKHNVGQRFDRDPELTSHGKQHARDMHTYRQSQHAQGMRHTDFVACSDMSRCADTVTTQLGMDTSNSELEGLKAHEKFTVVPRLCEFYRGKQALPSTQESFMTSYKNCNALTTMESARTYDPGESYESEGAFKQRIAQGISDVLDVAPPNATHLTLATHHGWAERASQLFGEDINLANGSAMVLPLIVKNKAGGGDKETVGVPENVRAARAKAKGISKSAQSTSLGSKAGSSLGSLKPIAAAA